ncbi:MAG: ABC transporter permease [Kiritimatiellaeota bacterium]|nr:ABC transporter permease [Kiritimatiellota bacterium]
MFSAIIKHRELTGFLIGRNLKIRYKNSALGFFWSLLTPAMMICVYAVFAKILKFNTGRPQYLQFLVSGIVVWQFTAGCLNDSLHAIAGNANLVKKVYFPRVILPVSTVLANAVNFGLTALVLVAYLALSGAADLSAAYWLVPAFAAHLALGVGIATLCATANVFFRDMEHIAGVVTLAWFFLSPVFYDASMQTNMLAGTAFAGHAWIVYLNPMSGILAMYRHALMGLPLTPADIPPAVPWLSVAVCAAMCIIGLSTLRAGDKKFGDVL